jgi:hypothetical protein
VKRRICANPEALFRIRIAYVRFGHAADLAVLQADLDASRVVGGRGEKVFYDTVGQFTAALIFFEDYGYFLAGIYVFPVLSVHRVINLA